MQANCPEAIAIIGMACVFPDAPDMAAFWRNIVLGVDALRPEGTAPLLKNTSRESGSKRADADGADQPLAEAEQHLIDTVIREALKNAGSGFEAPGGTEVAITRSDAAQSIIQLVDVLQGLRARRYDLAIAAAADFQESSTPSPSSLSLASSSLTAMCPFAAEADSALPGEGVVAVVLKRLADARRDGDHIHAVIRGIGLSGENDAMRGADAQGVDAQSADEVLALRRAYEEAGIDPLTVTLLEGHGWGTQAGDAAEVAALHEVFGSQGYAAVALGSVKSMLGHTGAAAGLAAIIKTALALYHRALPPTLHVERPRPELEDGRIYVNTATRPWLSLPATPHRAGVNIFDDSGIHCHLVLEAVEYSARRDWLTPRSSEMLIFAAATRDALLSQLRLWQNAIAILGPASIEDLRDAAFTASLRFQESKENNAANCGVRLAIVASSIADLSAKLARAVKRVGQDATNSWSEADGLYFRASSCEGKVAMLFPGIGFPGLTCGYTSRLAELCLHFPEVHRRVAFSDSACEINEVDDEYEYPLRYQLFPPPLLGAKDLGRIEKELGWSQRAASGVMAAHLASWDLMQALEVQPDALAGFSLGEWSALVAGGVIKDDNLLQFSNLVSSSYSKDGLNLPEKDSGCWAMVAGSAEQVETILRQVQGTACITMDVAPNQVFIGGEVEAVRSALRQLREVGVWGQELPFAAIHTPLAAEYVTMLQTARLSLQAQPARHVIYCGMSGRPYPHDPEQILDLLFEGAVHPVRIRDTMLQLHNDGVRIFVQLGSGGKLLTCIQNTLGSRSYEAFTIDRDTRGGLEQFHHMIGQLATLGVPLSLDRLYCDRPCVELDFPQLDSPTLDHAEPNFEKIEEKIEPNGARHEVTSNGAFSKGVFFNDVSSNGHGSITRVEEGILQKERHLSEPLSDPERMYQQCYEGCKPPPSGRVGEGAQPTVGLHHPPPTLPNGGGFASSATKAIFDIPSDISPHPSPRLAWATTMQRFLEIQQEQDEAETHLLTCYLETQQAVLMSFLSRAPAPINAAPTTSISSGARVEYPLLGEIQRWVPGKELESRLVLDLDEHLFLADHSLVRAPDHLKPPQERLPTLPMTVGIEIFMEAATTLFPDLRVLACHDIEAQRWIRLQSTKQLPIVITAWLVSEAEAQAEVQVELRVESEGKEVKPAFSGMVTLGASLFPAPAPMSLEFDRPCPHTPDQLYRVGRLFHGPRFQVLKVLHGMSDGSIATDVEVRDPQAMFASPLRVSPIIDPILLDGVGQGMGYRSQLDGYTIFPLKLKRVSIHGEHPAPGSLVHTKVAYRRLDSRRTEGDYDVFDERGNLWLRIEGWQIWKLLMSPSLQALTWQPEEEYLAVPGPVPDAINGQATCSRVHRDHLGEMDLEWLARLYLHGEEWEIYRAHRRLDWLLGRIAAKDAVRRHLRELQGVALHPLEVKITNLPSGAPAIASPQTSSLPLALSISHIEDEAIAVMAEASGVGVDLARVVERGSEFRNLAFTTDELDSLQSEYLASDHKSSSLSWLHRAWCAKEATAKAHGVGFNGLPQFQVRRVQADTGLIEVESVSDGQRHQVATYLDEDRAMAVLILTHAQ